LTSLVPLSTLQWSNEVVSSALSVIGFLVHPPMFLRKSVAELVPTFKDVQMIQTIGDDWEFIVSSEKEISSVSIPVQKTSLTFDENGNYISTPIHSSLVPPASFAPPPDGSGIITTILPMVPSAPLLPPDIPMDTAIAFT